MFDRIYLYFAMLVGSYGNIRLAWYILMVQVGICLHVRNQLVGQIRSWLASTEPIHIYLQAELFVVFFFSFQFFFWAAFKNKVLHIRLLQGFHLLMRIADICFVSFNLLKWTTSESWWGSYDQSLEGPFPLYSFGGVRAHKLQGESFGMEPAT